MVVYLASPKCRSAAYRPKGQERGQARAAGQGVLVQALPEASFTGENASTSVKALITFAWL
jgi:hypothetical protein